LAWRKKFRFQVPPGDNQLMAIGLVAAQWGIVENNLTLIAHGIYGDDQAAKIQYDKLQNFRKRSDILRDLIDRRVVEPHRTALLAHLDHVGSIVIQRDRIIHGLWGGENSDQDTDSGATHSFSWTAPKPIYNWRLSYAEILSVALKIDRLVWDIHQYFAGVMGNPPRFLLSDALRKISRPPEPPPA
jgi:hypothetical protein